MTRVLIAGLGNMGLSHALAHHHYPDAEIHRFPDCGHYILEDGGAELIEMIANFMGIRDDSENGHARGKLLERG